MNLDHSWFSFKEKMPWFDTPVLVVFEEDTVESANYKDDFEFIYPMIRECVMVETGHNNPSIRFRLLDLDNINIDDEEEEYVHQCWTPIIWRYVK